MLDQSLASVWESDWYKRLLGIKATMLLTSIVALEEKTTSCAATEDERRFTLAASELEIEKANERMNELNACTCDGWDISPSFRQIGVYQAGLSSED